MGRDRVGTGSSRTRIARSIVDINKIYHSLFNVYGICEALKTRATLHPEGTYKGFYAGRYNLAEGSGAIIFGKNLVSIDALLLHLSDPSKRLIASVNREPLKLAEAELGTVDRYVWDRAENKVGSWLS